ncbi:protein DBF4 homolog A-like isoform X2 [Myxocyprinus asiaticus]|uniref:protein DBF4 homolog A-like isoform X2 n=1 Tax=Myxocyprinus asiaticus TaxID=70543 RepID=UPI0022221B58|nr:protein DBF4 homolog A-like isoform X2 [Myxocyprinus asiaticus]
MKHESFPRCKGRDSKLEEQNGASSKSRIKATCDILQNKPFKGRIFYLDLPWNRRVQTLENDIKNLGGTVEKFFSKEIKYLVSSKPEARFAHRLLPDSPAPSPDSGVSSPHPSSRRDRHRDSSQGPTDTAAVSRGKSLVERVVKEQERVQMNGILAHAVEWGVKVLHVDDVISYVDKKKAKIIAVNAADALVKGTAKIQPTGKNTFQRYNGGRISRPFVKVEDSSRHYRPIYLPMPNMPVCNLRSTPPCSPFLVEEHGKGDQKKKQKEQRSGEERGTRGKKDRRRGHEGREKRKGGYCECCEVKFENLKAHLEGEQHLAFSKSEEYRVVDQVIAGLTCDLMNISSHAKSVSTPLLHFGAMLAVKEDVGTRGSDGNQEIKGFLLWDSTAKQPLSEQTREKPLLVRKRSRDQCEFPWSNRDSLLDQSDIPEKSLSKRVNFEWELHSQSAVQDVEARSSLSRDQQCASKTLECRTVQDQKTRTSHDVHPAQKFSERNIQSLTGRGCCRTTCSEMYTNTHCTQENQVENSAHWPWASTEPEPDMDSPSSSLQRKVRNVRPRRRKKETAVHIQSNKKSESLNSPSPTKPLKQCENLSASILELWQLFHSSDDMDEEFKGF